MLSYKLVENVLAGTIHIHAFSAHYITLINGEKHKKYLYTQIRLFEHFGQHSKQRVSHSVS